VSPECLGENPSVLPERLSVTAVIVLLDDGKEPPELVQAGQEPSVVRPKNIIRPLVTWT